MKKVNKRRKLSKDVIKHISVMIRRAESKINDLLLNILMDLVQSTTFLENSFGAEVAQEHTTLITYRY